MNAKKETPLSRELKLKFLNILKNGSVTVYDIAEINLLSGFELTTSINAYTYMSDEELDNQIAELERKLGRK